MKREIYSIVRFLFGLYIIWLGLINFNEIDENHTHIQHTITNYQQDLNIHKILNNFQLNDYISPKISNSIHIGFNSAMENLNQRTHDVIYLITFLFLTGGLLCSLGFRISSKLIQSAILLDLFFIHSYYYYRDERMKVNVLKIIAILGGAAHIF